jgi:hypothetical protein
MNVFKVIASAPRTNFAENQVSAFLGWMLNPYMDHGLGHEFLIKFLEKIGFSKEIIDRLRPNITGKNESVTIEVFLEHEVGDQIIDIVAVIDKESCIAIENKIVSTASKEEQLKMQYECLRKDDRHKKQKKIIVFLVPTKEGKLIEIEYTNLVVEAPDKKVKITWMDIAEIIRDILTREQNGAISPLTEYLRHTLKAFVVFANDGFKGYDTPKSENTSINPMADKGRLSFEEIKNDSAVTFVGVARGITGLCQMDVEKVKSSKFQCTTSRKKPNIFWLARERFIEMVDTL